MFRTLSDKLQLVAVEPNRQTKVCRTICDLRLKFRCHRNLRLKEFGDWTACLRVVCRRLKCSLVSAGHLRGYVKMDFSNRKAAVSFLQVNRSCCSNTFCRQSSLTELT